MVHIRVAFILLIGLLVTLVAGCTLPQGAVNGTSITTINVTQAPTPPLIVHATILPTLLPTHQTQCPTGKNVTPCIIINPVSEHYLGDVIEINGTTNCNSGEMSIWIRDTRFSPGCHGPSPSDAPCVCCEGVSITTPIILGNDGNNIWSVEVNTSQHNFYPGTFYVFVNSKCAVSVSGEFFEYLNLTAVQTPTPQKINSNDSILGVWLFSKNSSETTISFKSDGTFYETTSYSVPGSVTRQMAPVKGTWEPQNEGVYILTDGSGIAHQWGYSSSQDIIYDDNFKDRFFHRANETAS
jgi:hypothetical protein